MHTNSIARQLQTFTIGMSLLAALGWVAAGQLQAADKNEAAKQKEAKLLETLRSDAPAAEKAITCKYLAVYGSKDAVPELAKLLTNEQLASWARIALEAIPGPESDKALRTALGSVKGRLLVGTINSIGVRRDAAAVDLLAQRLNDPDVSVASAAAVALGHVGNTPASKALRPALGKSKPELKSAVAQGCILCAERLLADGKSADAAKLYSEVRLADLPKQRVLEATRGAILARKADGVPLLLELLRSQDKQQFQLGLGTAREIPGRQVAELIAAEVGKASPERAALLLQVLADRKDAAQLPAVLQAVQSGPKPVRIAAMNVLPRLGDVSCVPALLETALEQDAELAEAAKSALAGLPGQKVDAEITQRLPKAKGKTLPILLEVVGQRRIEAMSELVKAIDHEDAETRAAALTALGETVKPGDLRVLITQVIEPKIASDAPVAQKALHAACIRMPDREACAGELATALAKAPVATKCSLLEILGAMGGTKSLELLRDAGKSGDDELQNTSSRLLGAWMNADAAPVLLELANSGAEKYQGRALRGYLRLIRQFSNTMSESERSEMCKKAFAACKRPEDQKTVLEVVGRFPSLENLKLAIHATEIPAIKDDATRVTLVMKQKLGDKADAVKDLLAKVHLDPVKLEIIKAEYGVGTTQKDVTEVLAKQARDLPLITLTAPTYTANFGDPLPGTAKQLKVQYKINGKSGEASFADNAVIMLPMPK